MDKETAKLRSVKKDTPWGSEIRWAAMANVGGKILTILKGHKTSLKYIPSKDEVLYVMTGKIGVTHADEAVHHYTNVDATYDVLVPGEALSIPAMCIYRMEALEDSEIIEIGTRGAPNKSSDKIEDEYGRPVKPFYREIKVRKKDGQS